MKRRSFFHSALLAGLGLATGRADASGGRPEGETELATIDPDRVDPYFLDPGEISAEDQRSIEEYIGYQESAMEGRPAVMPRGGRPKRAPTYRLLYWKGKLGDPGGGWAGPLSTEPGLDGPAPYSFNAQILGFNLSTRDWSGSKGHGTLSIEFRAQNMGEPMTWLFLEQFETIKGGGNSVGFEYVAQRDGAPDPVVSEEPTLDMRIQLVRHRKAPGVLRKILKIGSFITGLPTGNAGGTSYSFAGSKPVVRVPRLAREGVAFAQATVGGISEEAPVWRGGFTSYALTSGGSRLALRPGLWAAVDDSQQIDFRSLRLDDVGGRLALTKDGEPVDLNFLVLGLEIKDSAPAEEALPKGVVPKGEASTRRQDRSAH